MNELWTSWLEQPVERALAEARVEFDQVDTHREQLNQIVDTFKAAVRANG